MTLKLPTINAPLFELNIPSQHRSVYARPFVVREEKILLTAQETRTEKDIILAIRQVLTNCIQEEGFDVCTLTVFDLEYMFLKLRARSVNNIVDVSYRDKEDDKIYEFHVDLDDVEMLENAEVSNKIMISDTVGIILRYPLITVLENAPQSTSPTELVSYLIQESIEQVFDEDSVYLASDYTPEEMAEFIESLDITTFIKIKKFFENLPRMHYKIDYKNSLGNDRSITLSSLTDFFTLV